MDLAGPDPGRASSAIPGPADGNGIELPKIIGHRGAAAAAPENTLDGLRAAARLGARWVEFDVKLTADGVPVLFHDETLDRTTGESGAVAETTFRDLRALDAGAWFGESWRGLRVPSFEEALTLLVTLDLHANVEIKPCPRRERETAAVTVETIRRVWPEGRPWPLLSSFAVDSLAEARSKAPGMPRGLLIWQKPASWATLAAELACRTVHCAEQYLTPAWAKEIKALGYGLAVYTVNEPMRAVELLRWGVDCIITDRPDVILDAVSDTHRNGL